MSLLTDFKAGDLRALSRLISLSENRDAAAVETLSQIFALPGHAKVIGVTGPPGAGKSTLLNSFIRFIRQKNQKVAVIAVDPVSPFTGGALLGDRIRLADHFNDPGVFIRSLSTRGKLGGLSLATREAVTLADRFGFDYVLIETVGVGQSEVDIRKMADVTLVALVPEWGDSVQALKAGILEIADVFVVNKADREGADRVVTENQNILQLAGRDETPVLKTSINNLPTVEALFEALEKFLATHFKEIQKKREESIQLTALELLESFVIQEAQAWVQAQVSVEKNPYQVVQKFQKKHPPGSLFS